jgi:hypothetical protein
MGEAGLRVPDSMMRSREYIQDVRCEGLFCLRWEFVEPGIGPLARIRERECSFCIWWILNDAIPVCFNLFDIDGEISYAKAFSLRVVKFIVCILIHGVPARRRI